MVSIIPNTNPDKTMKKRPFDKTLHIFKNSLTILSAIVKSSRVRILAPHKGAESNIKSSLEPSTLSCNRNNANPRDINKGVEKEI